VLHAKSKRGKISSKIGDWIPLHSALFPVLPLYTYPKVLEKRIVLDKNYRDSLYSLSTQYLQRELEMLADELDEAIDCDEDETSAKTHDQLSVVEAELARRGVFEPDQDKSSSTKEDLTLPAFLTKSGKMGH